MSKPRTTPVKGHVSPDVRTFYSALGQFNANIVTWYLQDPGKVKDILDWIIVQCPTHAAECNSLGPRYMWHESTHACVRVDGDFPDEGPVG